jgi:hypothetical protein
MIGYSEEKRFKISSSAGFFMNLMEIYSVGKREKRSESYKERGFAVPAASKFYVSIVIVGVVKDYTDKRDMMQLVVYQCCVYNSSKKKFNSSPFLRRFGLTFFVIFILVDKVRWVFSFIFRCLV